MMASPLLVLMNYSAIQYSKDAASATTSLVLHIVAWIAQFISHGFAEKKSPALLDNLSQGKQYQDYNFTSPSIGPFLCILGDSVYARI